MNYVALQKSSLRTRCKRGSSATCAHIYLLSENESFDALRLLADLLHHCGQNSAAGEIETPLVEARDLMGKARMTISPSSTDRATVSLQNGSSNNWMLDV